MIHEKRPAELKESAFLNVMANAVWSLLLKHASAFILNPRLDPGGFGLSRFCLGGFRLFLAVAFVEAVNAPGSVNQLLLAREKRVALRADFDVQVFLARRARGKTVAAGALHLDFVVFRMDSLFHVPLASFSIDGYQRLSRNKI
jgi:hypothetical protein